MSQSAIFAASPVVGPILAPSTPSVGALLTPRTPETTSPGFVLLAPRTAPVGVGIRVGASVTPDVGAGVSVGVGIEVDVGVSVSPGAGGSITLTGISRPAFPSFTVKV